MSTAAALNALYRLRRRADKENVESRHIIGVRTSNQQPIQVPTPLPTVHTPRLAYSLETRYPCSISSLCCTREDPTRVARHSMVMLYRPGICTAAQSDKIPAGDTNIHIKERIILPGRKAIPQYTEVADTSRGSHECSTYHGEQAGRRVLQLKVLICKWSSVNTGHSRAVTLQENHHITTIFCKSGIGRPNRVTSPNGRHYRVRIEFSPGFPHAIYIWAVMCPTLPMCHTEVHEPGSPG